MTSAPRRASNAQRHVRGDCPEDCPAAALNLRYNRE
jgi:hypothetical protein